MIYQQVIDSPVGELIVQSSDKGLTYVGFDQHKKQAAFLPNPHTQAGVQQLQEYFLGKRKQFVLPLDVTGTAFQQQVWQQLTCIEYGATQSYSWVSEQLNNPKAVRAVGAANGKNPISIIVPCHRVIGANGSLTGYAGGVERKAWLLAFEKGS